MTAETPAGGDPAAGPPSGELSETLQDLNARYGIGGAVRFGAGPGGLAVAHLRSGDATATVALLGATVIGYQPAGGAPVLLLSRHSALAPGQPIRGGIPVCWPWFGPYAGAGRPVGVVLPNHGFVRLRQWDVEETGTVEPEDADPSLLPADPADPGVPDGPAVPAPPAGPHPQAELVLRLTADDETRAMWPHPFTARLTVRLGTTLRVILEVEHAGERGDAPWTCTGALHTYLAVGDASRLALFGLEDTSYVDKVAGGALRRQEGPVTIGAETDRVYVDTAAPVTVEDPALGRRLTVAKGGSRTTVVWNPWEDRARALPDFGDDEYQGMVCVETANALEDAVTLAPGESHRLETEIAAG